MDHLWTHPALYWSWCDCEACSLHALSYTCACRRENSYVWLWENHNGHWAITSDANNHMDSQTCMHEFILSTNVASTTTPTPAGLMASNTASAISLVSLSCTERITRIKGWVRGKRGRHKVIERGKERYKNSPKQYKGKGCDVYFPHSVHSNIILGNCVWWYAPNKQCNPIYKIP